MCSKPGSPVGKKQLLVRGVKGTALKKAAAGGFGCGTGPVKITIAYYLSGGRGVVIFRGRQIGASQDTERNHLTRGSSGQHLIRNLEGKGEVET